MKRNYIGLASTFHDSALAIVNSKGKVVFAEASERYLQSKKAMNISPDMMFRIKQLLERYCEPDAELVVATSWSKQQQAYVSTEIEELKARELKVKEAYGEVPFFIHRDMLNQRYQLEMLRDSMAQAGRNLAYEISQLEGRFDRPAQVRGYDHHLCHAATACYSSPFDEGVCAIIDGEGELGKAHDLFRYERGRITRLDEMPQGKTGSLGIFFWMVCQACGFGILTGEEWKVMGLAPYGGMDKKTEQFLRTMIQVKGLQIESASTASYTQILYELHRMQRKQGEAPITSKNLAHTGQQVFMDVTYKLLRNLYECGYSKNLIAGGGCMLNSTANGRICEATGFERLHVYSAPADDGNALGAAWLAYQEDHPEFKPEQGPLTPYLGAEMSEETTTHFLRYSKLPGLMRDPAGICKRAATLLAEGKIIGWVQGRAEFGPRALGNRSILADPRSPQTKDEINGRVKFREEFRPFAPSILAEFGPEYFENYQESPYMERTLTWRDEVRHKVPAVVHVNGSGRLQSVKEAWNPRYYQLIQAFFEITGIPLILNTSFNIMGKPIIHTVEDALAVFYTTGLDALILDDILIEK